MSAIELQTQEHHEEGVGMSMRNRANYIVVDVSCISNLDKKNKENNFAKKTYDDKLVSDNHLL